MWTSEIGGKVSDDLSGERYTVTCGCGYSDADGRCGAPHRDTAQCNDSIDTEADRQADAANESDLDALLERMTTEPACAKTYVDMGDCADGCECLDWTDLPTFGPEPKRISEGTWSWSPTRIIVGTCADDLEIVGRMDAAGDLASIDPTGVITARDLADADYRAAVVDAIAAYAEWDAAYKAGIVTDEDASEVCWLDEDYDGSALVISAESVREVIAAAKRSEVA